MNATVRNAQLRVLGLVAIPTSLLLIFLTPVQAKAFDEEPRAWLVELTGVHAFADRVWGELGGSLDRYDFWGRWTVVGYLGALVGIWAFRRLCAPSVPGWRLLIGSLGVAAIGDFFAYWFPSEVLTSIGGSLEFFMLPLIVGGMFRYAWVLIRQETPTWPGWVLAASGMAVIPSMAATNYWPHGALVPVSVGIAVLAVAAASKVEMAER